jgi:hypothetical protein
LPKQLRKNYVVITFFIVSLYYLSIINGQHRRVKFRADVKV